MKNPAKTVGNLLIRQKAQPLVLAGFRLSRTFQLSKTYGLPSQFRRTAESIVANIAEGWVPIAVRSNAIGWGRPHKSATPTHSRGTEKQIHLKLQQATRPTAAILNSDSRIL